MLCSEEKIEEGQDFDLHLRYEAVVEQFEGDPWCPEHAPIDHAVRLFTGLGQPGDCSACGRWSRLARLEWADRVLHSLALDGKHPGANAVSVRVKWNRRQNEQTTTRGGLTSTPLDVAIPAWLVLATAE